MLDRFFLDHREICLQPGLLQLGDLQRKVVTACASYPVRLPPDELMEFASTISDHSHVVELHMNRTLVWFNPNMDAPERRVCELIVMHKMQNAIDEREITDRKKRLRAVLGAMSRQRLIRLLLEIGQDDAAFIYRLGQIASMHRDLWEGIFIGAASCARTVRGFWKTDLVDVYLPSIRENVEAGIDMIAVGEQDHWCVDIHTGVPNGPLYLEHVAFVIDADDRKTLSRRHIYEATQNFNRHYGKDFRACRVIVGKTSGEVYDLRTYQDDIDRIARFLEVERNPRSEPTEKPTEQSDAA